MKTDSITIKQAIVRHTIQEWRCNGNPDASRLFSENPSIASDKSLQLDLAYEEYCLRIDAGEQVSVEDFCNKFSSLSQSLFRLISLHDLFQKHSSVIPEETAWPCPGEEFFDFHILEEVGRGSLSRVYLCEQLNLGSRQVILKVARYGAYEADTIGRLNHPNIVPIYSVEQDDDAGISCICMPFLGRSTLLDLLDLVHDKDCSSQDSSIVLQAATKRQQDHDQYECTQGEREFLSGRAYIEEAIRLLIQLADALDHAHSRGIFHSDLKPSNILLTCSGTPLLMDFNLSVNEDLPDQVYGGTLPYMAPEHIRALLTPGKKLQTPGIQSDIYSFGVISCELLLGHAPIVEPAQDSSLQQWPASYLHPSSRNIESDAHPGVSGTLIELMKQCTALEEKDRPASMAEVRDVLKKHLTNSFGIRGWTKAHPWHVSLGAGACMLLASVLIAIVMFRAPISAREFQAGLACYERNEIAPAIKHFNACLERDPSDANAHFWRGKSLVELKEYDRAIDDFVASNELHQHGRNAEYIGYCYSLKGDHPKAISWYELALDQGFDSVSCLNNMGLCFLNRSKADLEKAASYFERSILLDPNQYNPHRNLATVELRISERDGSIPWKGIEHIERAIELAEDHPCLHVLAARLYGCAAKEDPETITKCLAHLGQGKSLGADLRRLGLEFDPAFSEVRNSEGFRMVMGMHSKVKSVPPLSRLVGPYRR